MLVARRLVTAPEIAGTAAAVVLRRRMTVDGRAACRGGRGLG
jgi:hypothetical protein